MSWDFLYDLCISETKQAAFDILIQPPRFALVHLTSGDKEGDSAYCLLSTPIGVVPKRGRGMTLIFFRSRLVLGIVLCIDYEILSNSKWHT